MIEQHVGNSTEKTEEFHCFSYAIGYLSKRHFVNMQTITSDLATMISVLFPFHQRALEDNSHLKNTFSYKYFKSSLNQEMLRNGTIIDNRNYELSLEKQVLAAYTAQTFYNLMERRNLKDAFKEQLKRAQEIRRMVDTHFYSENLGLYADLVSAQWLPQKNKEGELVPPVTWREDRKCGEGFPSEYGFAAADCSHPVTAVPYMSPKAYQEATEEELAEFKAGKEKARLANRARCCVNNSCENAPVCASESKSVSIDDSLTARRQNQFSPVISVVNLWPLLFYSELPETQDRFFPQFFSQTEENSHRLEGMLALILDSQKLKQTTGLRRISKDSFYYRGEQDEGFWEGWLEFHFLLLRGLKIASESHPELAGHVYEQLKSEVLSASSHFEGDSYSEGLLRIVEKGEFIF